MIKNDAPRRLNRGCEGASSGVLKTTIAAIMEGKDDKKRRGEGGHESEKLRAPGDWLDKGKRQERKRIQKQGEGPGLPQGVLATAKKGRSFLQQSKSSSGGLQKPRNRGGPTGDVEILGNVRVKKRGGEDAWIS